MTDNKDNCIVKVKFMGDIVSAFGKREIELPMPGGSNLDDLLKHLCNSYGETFSNSVFNAAGGLLPNLVVFVNGEDIKSLKGLETPISDGEVEVVVLPIFEGG